MIETVSLIRGCTSGLVALLVTVLLCFIAPLISSKRNALFTEPVAAVQVSPPPLTRSIEDKKKLQPRKLHPLPKIPKRSVPRQQPLKKIEVEMKPLRLELPKMQAATLPVMVPEAKLDGESGFGGTGIFNLDAVDTPPRLQKYVPPLYPPAARGQQIEGKVVVRCIVTSRGQVKEMKIISAEPTGFFEKAALKAIAGWTFIAARYKGETVPVYVDIPLTFSLK